MLKYIIIILFIALGLLLLVRRGIKIHREADSKLSILEHPSTFEKPRIELVEKKHNISESADSQLPITRRGK
jgi:hypothetical protein